MQNLNSSHKRHKIKVLKGQRKEFVIFSFSAYFSRYTETSSFSSRSFVRSFPSSWIGLDYPSVFRACLAVASRRHDYSSWLIVFSLQIKMKMISSQLLLLVPEPQFRNSRFSTPTHWNGYLIMSNLQFGAWSGVPSRNQKWEIGRTCFNLSDETLWIYANETLKRFVRGKRAASDALKCTDGSDSIFQQLSPSSLNFHAPLNC